MGIERGTTQVTLDIPTWLLGKVFYTRRLAGRTGYTDYAERPVEQLMVELISRTAELDIGKFNQELQQIQQLEGER